MSGPRKEHTIKNVERILRKLPKRDQRILTEVHPYTISDALRRFDKAWGGRLGKGRR